MHSFFAANGFPLALGSARGQSLLEMAFSMLLRPSHFHFAFFAACRGTIAAATAVLLVGAGSSAAGQQEPPAALAAGGYHSVAVDKEGVPFVWGMASYGALAKGDSWRGGEEKDLFAFVWPYGYRLAPLRVEAADPQLLEGIAALSAGRHFTLALKRDGTVVAWGSNDFGQLGDGSTEKEGPFYEVGRMRSEPGLVTGPGGGDALRGVKAVAAGYQHALALTKDGKVFAWGDNSGGQLGNGREEAQSHPVEVLGIGGKGPLEKVRAVAAGTRHNLALLEDGTVVAWGSNTSGQLGNGEKKNSAFPVPVQNPGGNGLLAGIQAVAAGTACSLALGEDGSVYAWGDNSFGQLGDGTRRDSARPVAVKGLDGGGVLRGIAAIVAGRYFNAALNDRGEVLAWGWNEAGLLGDGNLEGSLFPQWVREADGGGRLRDIVRLDAGSRHLLALRADGSLVAWGSNIAGQLGDAGKGSGLRPVTVKGITLPGSKAGGGAGAAEANGG